MSSDKEKKQRVLHTRIPESLDEEIRERSERLGISVSNLVRNVLQNAFGLVEGIVTDSANIARSARGASGASGAADVPVPPAGATIAVAAVLGWNEAVLNLNAVCAECNTILPRGERAAIGIAAGGGQPPIVCLSCMNAVVEGETDDR